MFFFLSKLLPLFFYPLGLASLLLLLALILLWKRPKLAAIPIVLSFILLVCSSSGWLSTQLVQSLEFQHLPNAELPKTDAIVVLGGCTRSADPPRPWVELEAAGDRLVYAAKLYRDGKAPRVILSGGRTGGSASESADMATLIQAMGVPSSAILQDPTSLNTYENAVNIKKILDEQGLRRVLLVTSAMHMPRSMLIFKKLKIEAIAAPADFLTTFLNSFQGKPQPILLKLLPDADYLKESTRALKEYVGIATYWLRGWL